MKFAILVLGNGRSIELHGRFILLTETAGDRELAVADSYRDGLPSGCGVVCDTTEEALEVIEIMAKKRPRKRARR